MTLPTADWRSEQPYAADAGKTCPARYQDATGRVWRYQGGLAAHEPTYREETQMITTLHGDCRDILPTLAPESVQCVVTSPPYFGLRDYGTAQWDGGDPGCDHRGMIQHTNAAGSAKQASNAGAIAGGDGDCACGARRIDRQIGLEPIPDCLAWARQEPPCDACYVCALRTVFAGLWRVLKRDGVAWLNLGDSYARNGGTQGGGNRALLHMEGTQRRMTKIPDMPGMREKSLLLIPSRVALALQSDGWIVRSEIVWAKGNPMPESVTDRPTRSHEAIYLLAKQARYYYDAAAVAEAAVNGDPSAPRAPRGALPDGVQMNGGRRDKQGESGLRRYDGFNERYEAAPPRCTRNLRDVWQINPRPFSGAHFAVFPEAIPERCIRASTRPGDMVLDPFGGSGTTARVATRLQRNCTLIELNAAYLDIQETRTDGVQVELLL